MGENDSKVDRNAGPTTQSHIPIALKNYDLIILTSLNDSNKYRHFSYNFLKLD